MSEDFKRLLSQLKPYKKRLSFIITLGFMISLLKALIPELMRQLTEKAWVSNDRELALYIPIAIGAIWCVVNILRYFHLYWMKYVGEELSVNMRRNLMNKYLNLNLSYLNSFVRGSGGLISRMLNDITAVHHGVIKIADLIREPFTALFAFCYLLYIDWALVLFLIVTLPVVLLVTKSLARSLRKYGHRSMETMEDLTKTVKESLDGTRIVQSFNLQSVMRERFDKQAQTYLKTRSKIIQREEISSPISESLTSISLAIILVYIGNQIFNNKLTIGDFLAFSFALAMIGDSVKKIQVGFVYLQQAFVALSRYDQILTEGQEVSDPAIPTPYPENWSSIKYKNVSFSFSDKPVLKNINLEIKRGEVVALVGSSGGGKSTFVNLLGRFFEPGSGEITIDNTPIQNFSLSEYRAHVALVSQDVFLFSDSIEHNIQAGDFSKSKPQVKEAATLANAHEFISNTPEGYESLCGERGALLSGGEKQRISIARAILKDAPILILDEATSALDNESEKEVQKGLSELMKGRTTFVIAHRLSTIQTADRILVMKDGQIHEQGSHKELLEKNGEYARLYNI